MEKTNDNFSNVLKKAQKLGYAEPGNPKLDLNGYDAFAKVKILSALAFNKRLSNSVSLMEGIENIEPKDFEIADQLNLRIKLLGITEIINNKLFERVHPCLVKKKIIYWKCKWCNECSYYRGQTSRSKYFTRRGCRPWTNLIILIIRFTINFERKYKTSFWNFL